MNSSSLQWLIFSHSPVNLCLYFYLFLQIINIDMLSRHDKNHRFRKVEQNFLNVSLCFIKWTLTLTLRYTMYMLFNNNKILQLPHFSFRLMARLSPNSLHFYGMSNILTGNASLLLFVCRPDILNFISHRIPILKSYFSPSDVLIYFFSNISLYL